MKAVVSGDAESMSTGANAQSVEPADALTGPASPQSTWSDDESEQQTFVGELSIPALPQASSNQGGSMGSGAPKETKSHPLGLHPRRHTFADCERRPEAQKRSRRWPKNVLDSHGVEPDELEWETLLEVCFDEVHVLYPFLHPPSVRQTFAHLRKNSFALSLEELEGSHESRLTTALVFICLALGRCTASSRVDKEDGAHSAGWSLFSIAIDLARPWLDVVSGPAVCLPSLQVFALMVSIAYPYFARHSQD